MAEVIQRKFLQEVEKYKTIQKDIQKFVVSRQQLDSQLSENNLVKEEVDLLEPAATVFKLVGPVLVKQDVEEAKQNVNKRIEYITGELARHDKLLDDLNQKQEAQRESVGKMKQQLDQLEVKAAMKS